MAKLQQLPKYLIPSIRTFVHLLTGFVNLVQPNIVKKMTRAEITYLSLDNFLDADDSESTNAIDQLQSFEDMNLLDSYNIMPMDADFFDAFMFPPMPNERTCLPPESQRFEYLDEGTSGVLQQSQERADPTLAINTTSTSSCTVVTAAAGPDEMEDTVQPRPLRYFLLNNANASLSRRRKNKKPIEVGNNVYGRGGKLRCSACRKRKGKVRVYAL
jgi:hypothetical protein